MNREIRFRSKDEHGNWQYGHIALVEFYVGLQCWKMFNTDQGKEGIAVNPKTIGQSTGLYDKNGVEIYEGDIVAFIAYCEKHIGVVEYSDCTFHVGTQIKGDLGVNHGEPLCESSDDYFEVIGNIHENPELMEYDE